MYTGSFTHAILAHGEVFFHIADYRQTNDELALNESLADFK